MNLYTVSASYVTYLSIDIEAESEQAAMEIAKAMEGGEFNVDFKDDWTINTVDFQSSANYSNEDTEK